MTLVLACSGLLSNRIHHFSSDSDSFFFLETKANFKIGTEKIFFFFFCGGQGSLHGRKQEFFIAGFFQCLSLSSLPLSFLFFFVVSFSFCHLEFLSMFHLSLIITFIFSTSGIHLNPCLMHSYLHKHPSVPEGKVGILYRNSVHVRLR